MKKALVLNGNSWQIYLTSEISKMLGINKEEYNVSLVIDNKILYVKQINKRQMQAQNNILVKKLIKRGAGFGLNITLPVLGLLEINPDSDFVDIEIINNQLIIKKYELNS